MKEGKSRKKVIRVSQARAKAFVELSKVSKFTYNKNNSTFNFEERDWMENNAEIMGVLSKYKYNLIY